MCIIWAVLFGLFQLTNAYHFYYWEQHQLFLPTNTYSGFFCWADYLSEWLTQWYYWRYAGPAILASLLTLTAIMLYVSIRRLASAWLSFIIVILFVSANVFIHFGESNMTKAQVVLLTVSDIAAILSRYSRYSAGLIALAIIPLCWMEKSFGLPKLDFERRLAVENEYYFGNYEKAEKLVKDEENPSDQMIFYYNLIQARRGALPDHLFDMPKQILGTEIVLSDKSSRGEFRAMPDFYYEVGDMVYAERAAMLCMVFTENNIFTPMLKRLAEVNLVASDTIAAMKYLRILKQAPAYREWAERHTPGQMSPIVEKDILRRRAFINQTDTIRHGADSHRILETLLDTNKGNVVALDYLLCTYMLEKNREGFLNAYNKYGPRHKKLYEMGLR